MNEDAAAKLPEHEAALETVLAVLAEVGNALCAAPRSQQDLRPIARAVEAATGAVLDAYDARRDPLGAVRDAVVRVDEISELLSAAFARDSAFGELFDWLAKARGWLLVAERAFENRPARLSEAREVVASAELPELHQLARASIVPRYDVPEPLAAERPVPQLERDPSLSAAERLSALREHQQRLRKQAAERRDARHNAREQRLKERKQAEQTVQAPGLVPGSWSAQTLAQFRRERARDLWFEIATMGAQRTPMLGDYWRGSVVFDRRMLRAADALAGLGEDAVNQLESLFWDSPAKDGSHVFGLCFALGSFSGRDALAAIERVIRVVALEDATILGEAAHALKLVPHDRLRPLLTRWLHDAEEGLQTLAVDVLGHRRWISPKTLVELASGASERVATKALLHAAPHKPEGLGSALDRHAAAKTEALRAATAWATVMGGVAFPLDRLRPRIESDANALLPFALAAEREDAQLLLDRLQLGPSRALIEALGFLGHPHSLAPLVATLENIETPPELLQTTAFALQRITGAELYETVEVPVDHKDPETPPDPPLPGEQASPTRRGAGRDRPQAGANDVEKLPTTDPERWREFLAAEDVRFQGERRLRRGQPYTPEQSLVELDSYQVTPTDRRTLYREIVVKAGASLHFDPVDFVAQQEAALSALGSLCSKASSVPGAWGMRLTSG
jgi:hypothetical protein